MFAALATANILMIGYGRTLKAIHFHMVHGDYIQPICPTAYYITYYTCLLRLK